MRGPLSSATVVLPSGFLILNGRSLQTNGRVRRRVPPVPPMPGLRGHATHTVTDADTALSLRSGDVPVLGTPRLVALLEEATMVALEGTLDYGETSVGMRINVDHVAPVAPGTSLKAEAVLDAVEGRRLNFVTTARAGDIEVARASITRVVVETQRFLDRIDGAAN